MRVTNRSKTLLLSATDLTRFMGCPHATVLDLTHLRGEGPEPAEASEDAALFQKQGDAHEATHLDEIKAGGRTVIEIPRGPLAKAAQATCDAIAAGADVIYQGAFLSGQWGGWADFLERVEIPSDLGPFSYEVADTKLKRHPHPKHVLQLVLYSDLLAEIQGRAPEYAHLDLGDGTRATLRLVEYAAYARMARARLEAFVTDPPATRPVPCADCALCRWADHCQSVWDSEDSLFNIAGIARGQVKKLEAAGITTMQALARHDAPIRGMAAPTLDKLRAQARLQHARKSGPPTHELRPHMPGKGFDLLPQPQPGDLFYDIEGDPHYEGGLEYLHGVWFDDEFRAFWAHDHAEEAQSLAALLAFFRDRLDAFPKARIYHYAPYEITALRRLTTTYGIGEAFLDRLLRERRFVDLYAVVRGGVTASERNYSIKSMEAFYNITRDGDVKSGGGSVVAYEEWRETREQRILDEIEDYNRIDCISTEKLRDWLVGIRPDGPWPVFEQDAREQEVAEDEATTALRQALANSRLPAARQDMLFNLAQFHTRETKPAWWAIFDSLGKDDEDLIDDLDALGGLVAKGKPYAIKRSTAQRYSFPPQQTKLRSGSSASVPTPEGFETITVEELDMDAREVTLKVGNARADILQTRLNLHPGKPLKTDVLRAAIADVIRDQCDGPAFRAVDDLLSRTAPRLTGPQQDILQGDDIVAGMIDAVLRMDETVLPVQGPPGTGKTYLTARAILALVRKGHRVGVASNSHEAIRNVLIGCLLALEDQDLPIDLELVHKVSGDQDGYPDDCAVTRTNDNATAAATGHVVGGTAFFFARDENVQAYDWLFVDEAGQVGLANMVAMGGAARNIVLVGDPQQLPQVIQGAHPAPTNLSCLELLLADRATIPLDRGIFLGVTRRMHPDVNRFISDQVYEGRLTSHADTASQRVAGTSFPEAGAFWVPVAHQGNAQMAPEEIGAILRACDDLLKGIWTDKDGQTRRIRRDDIIIVAPYNLQVNALRAALPDEIRVGTVDKFQGQEAPICIVSMAASSAEESPRGMEFLFSLSRINVAVSRAKGLALVFGAPRLREAKCETVEQMRLVNTLCALEYCLMS